jgi:hypothetical protein
MAKRVAAAFAEKAERQKLPTPTEDSKPEFDSMKFKSAIERAGILPGYSRWRLKNWGRRREEFDWSNGGFVISGVNGCGKSCLAAALAIDRLHPGHPETLAKISETVTGQGQRSRQWVYPVDGLRWDYCPSMLRLIRSSNDPRSRETEEELINRYCRYELLVIDDAGAEKSTEYTWATLAEIIEKRVHSNRHVIVTTNRTVEEFASLEAEKTSAARIASRLLKLGTIELPQVDLRVQERKGRSVMTVVPEIDRRPTA